MSFGELTVLNTLGAQNMNFEENLNCDIEMENPINPLMIDLILQEVFKRCHFKELAVCRRVCKFWHKLSLPLWLDKGPIILLQHEDPYISNLTVYSERRCKFSSFLEKCVESNNYFESCGLQKYKKFGFHLTLMGNNDLDLFRKFWNQLGHSITELKFMKKFHLTLETPLFQDMVFCRHTPYLEVLEASIVLWQDGLEEQNAENKVPQVQVNPHLKSLKLDINFDELSFSDLPLHVPVCWKQLLECYPNLKHLGLNLSSSEYCLQELEKMINTVKDIRLVNKQKLNLKSLDILLSDSDTIDINAASFPKCLLDLFMDTGLTLESFSFTFGLDIPPTLVYDALHFQRNSLKSLKFYRFSPSENFMALPVIETLCHLTLLGHPFNNFSWLKGVPNLVSLKLLKDNEDNMRNIPYDEMMPDPDPENEHGMNGFVLPFLTTFYCNYYYEWRAAYLERFAEWMPNLKNLRLDIGNQTFHLVCRYWPSLEKLQIAGDHLDDVGLTGVEMVPKYTNLFGVVTKWKKRVVYPQNVSHFHELRTFTMEQFFETTASLEIRITKASAFHGFFHCPKLEHLQVDMKGLSEKEEASVSKSILSRIPNAKIGFTGGATRTESYDKRNRLVLSLFHDIRSPWDPINFDFESTISSDFIQSSLRNRGDSFDKLEFYRYEPLENFTFPVIHSLRNLILKGRPLTNLTFLKSLPNLASLKLEKDACDPYLSEYPEIILKSFMRPDMKAERFKSLTTFHCDYYYEWRHPVIRKLQSWMPNLKQLGLDIGNDSLQLICIYWPYIQNLTVYGDHLDDFGITGIWFAAKQTHEVTQYPRNITHLKELRDFAMESFSNSFMEVKLTKESILHGFLKCPKLENIRVKVIDDENTGCLAVQLLKKAVPNAEVQFVAPMSSTDRQNRDWSWASNSLF